MNRRAYTVHAGWCIDGTGAPARRNVRLSVVDGVITDIDCRPQDSVPPGTDLIDLSACTVLPPLVDAHVHLCLSGSVDKKVRVRQLTATASDNRSTIADHLRDHWRFGVHAVRDGGDQRSDVSGFQARPAADTPPVRVQSPGAAWHAKGRYGGFIGRSPQDGETLARAVQTGLERCDHVKIINSGLNSLQEFGKQTEPQFSREEIATAVRVAHAGGKKVMVHANGVRPVRDALLAGCDSIEHGYFMGRDNLELMADKQTAWVPTAVVMQVFASLHSREISQYAPEVAVQTLQDQIAAMARARKLGVPMAVGTDAGCIGVAHGSSVVRELRLFMDAGFSREEALHCCSVQGAKLLNLPKGSGTLQRGARADFIAVPSEPERLVDTALCPSVIVVSGQLHEM